MVGWFEWSELIVWLEKKIEVFYPLTDHAAARLVKTTIQLMTSSTDLFVVAQMSFELVGFVNLVDVRCDLDQD